MIAKAATAPSTSKPESAAGLRHYTPAELVAPDGDFRLPTTESSLKALAYARKIPWRKVGGRVSFTLADIREISEIFAIKPLKKSRAA